MGKVLGILLFVLVIWAGLELSMNGVDGAFNGALTSFGGSQQEEVERDDRSIPRRAGDSVQRAHDEADARRNRLLGEEAR